MAAKQVPMYATQLAAGTKVKGVGKFASIGEAIVLFVNQSLRGHMKVKVELSILTGDRAGTTTTLTYPANCNILNTLEIMGKTSAAKLKKERVAKYEKDTDRYYAKELAVAKAELKFAPGDLVKIEGKKDSWRMKVLEIDEQKGRIKGISADSLYGPGSKMGWASLTHPDVKVTLIEKNHFNPEADDGVKQLMRNRVETSAKRTATRQRSADLRNYYGIFN